jgi:hypothetical protein
MSQFVARSILLDGCLLRLCGLRVHRSQLQSQRDTVLAARGETPAAFGRRCIPAALGATLDFHHGLLGVVRERARRPLGGQAVPVAVHGVGEARTMRTGLDLLPETGNRMIDGAGVGHIEVAPHLSKQLVAVDDPLVPLDIDQRMRFSRTDWQSPQREAIREGQKGGQRLVRPEGLEPPAYRFEACRSIQLSYGRSSSLPVLALASGRRDGTTSSPSSPERQRRNGYARIPS